MSTMMTTIQTYLKGRKTYLLGAGVLIAALVAVADGDTSRAWDHLVQGLGLIFLRAGIDKAGTDGIGTHFKW